jgi:hypothetical protein
MKRSRRVAGLEPEVEAVDNPDGDRHGSGIGVPGKRKATAVREFKSLNFDTLDKRLPKFLDISAEVQQQKKDDRDKYLEPAKALARKHNRRVDYGGPDENTGLHSLHIAQDVYAYWNSSVKGTGKGYTYEDLAPKLDKRLDAAEGAKGKEKGVYWTRTQHNAKRDDRRKLVAQGIQHVISGNLEEAEQHFDRAGLTVKGRKWAHKMATISLAEQARALHGAEEHKDAVKTSLGHVGAHSFKDVFVTRQKDLAPFAAKGGASWFKK